MYKRCPTEKGAAQQRILEDTLFSMMQETPYADISVRGLCEQAGISRKTFYRLYEKKDDVLIALIDQTYRSYVHFQMPEENIVEGPLKGLQNFFYYWKQQNILLDVLKANHKSSLLIERSVAHIQEEDSDILRYIGGDNPRCSREIVLFFSSGCMALVIDWHETGYKKSVAEMADIFRNLLISPPIRGNVLVDE